MSQGGRPQDIIQVPKLEPKDLYDRRVRRDFARLRAYNTLLEQIYHRVYATSQLSGNTSSVLYSVPPFIMGLPKMDMEDCIVYLVWQLRQSGFEVRFTWPNILYISWSHHESEYLSKKNPIVQAMIPDVPPPPPKPLPLPKGQKKKATDYVPPSERGRDRSVAFNQEIDIITNTGSSSVAASFGEQPQRSPDIRSTGYGGAVDTTRWLGQSGRRATAAEYQPPDSFIQNLERPDPFGPKGPGPYKDGAKGNVLADLWTI